VEVTSDTAVFWRDGFGLRRDEGTVSDSPEMPDVLGVKLSSRGDDDFEMASAFEEFCLGTPRVEAAWRVLRFGRLEVDASGEVLR